MATELRRVLPHGIIHVRGAEYFGDTQLSRLAGQTVLLDIPEGELPSELAVKLIDGDRLVHLGTVVRDRGYMRRICPWIPSKEVLAQHQGCPAQAGQSIYIPKDHPCKFAGTTVYFPGQLQCGCGPTTTQNIR